MLATNRTDGRLQHGEGMRSRIMGLSPTTQQTTESYPSRLIVVEGLDGSGKSTQIDLLHGWLEDQGAEVIITRWNESSLTKRAVKKGKKRKRFGALSFCLIHATDFAHRYETVILPALRAGKIVLADRYVYTAFARDVARGIDPGAVRRLYSYVVKPDLTLYFRVPIDVALQRLLRKRPNKGVSYYEAGMDLGLTEDPVESYRLFQHDVQRQYDRMVEEYGLKVIDAQRPIEVQRDEVLDHVLSVLHDTADGEGLEQSWLAELRDAS